MKACLVAVLLLGVATVRAQQTVNVDQANSNAGGIGMLNTVNGQFYTNTKYVRLVEGSPFFREDYLPGILVLGKNARSKGQLKLDLFDNQVLFTDAGGNEMVAIMPDMQRISLTSGDTTFTFLHKSLLPPGRWPARVQWLQQLFVGDSVQLYQYLHKELSEFRQYNSATYEQSIRTRVGYVLVQKEKAFVFQKPKDLIGQLPQWAPQLLNWIQENELLSPEEEKMRDLAALVDALLHRK